jgi:hypothetical protein
MSENTVEAVSHELFARLVTGRTGVHSISIEFAEESRGPSRWEQGHEGTAPTPTEKASNTGWTVAKAFCVVRREGVCRDRVLMHSTPTLILKHLTRNTQFLWINSLTKRRGDYLRSMPLNVVMVQFDPQVRPNYMGQFL